MRILLALLFATLSHQLALQRFDFENTPHSDRRVLLGFLDRPATSMIEYNSIGSSYRRHVTSTANVHDMLFLPDERGLATDTSAVLRINITDPNAVPERAAFGFQARVSSLTFSQNHAYVCGLTNPEFFSDTVSHTSYLYKIPLNTDGGFVNVDMSGSQHFHRTERCRYCLGMTVTPTGNLLASCFQSATINEFRFVGETFDAEMAVAFPKTDPDTDETDTGPTHMAFSIDGSKFWIAGHGRTGRIIEYSYPGFQQLRVYKGNSFKGGTNLNLRPRLERYARNPDNLQFVAVRGFNGGNPYLDQIDPATGTVSLFIDQAASWERTSEVHNNVAVCLFGCAFSCTYCVSDPVTLLPRCMDPIYLSPAPTPQPTPIPPTPIPPTPIPPTPIPPTPIPPTPSPPTPSPPTPSPPTPSPPTPSSSTPSPPTPSSSTPSPPTPSSSTPSPPTPSPPTPSSSTPSPPTPIPATPPTPVPAPTPVPRSLLLQTTISPQSPTTTIPTSPFLTAPTPNAPSLTSNNALTTRTDLTTEPTVSPSSAMPNLESPSVLDPLILVLMGVAALCCCICFLLLLFVIRRRRGNSQQDEEVVVTELDDVPIAPVENGSTIKSSQFGEVTDEMYSTRGTKVLHENTGYLNIPGNYGRVGAVESPYKDPRTANNAYHDPRSADERYSDPTVLAPSESSAPYASAVSSAARPSSNYSSALPNSNYSSVHHNSASDEYRIMSHDNYDNPRNVRGGLLKENRANQYDTTPTASSQSNTSNNYAVVESPNPYDQVTTNEYA